MSDHQPARHAEEPADVEVLAGLGHHPLVGCDHQHHQVHPARARSHGPHEPLVPGDVHDTRHRAAGERQVGEARARW